MRRVSVAAGTLPRWGVPAAAMGLAALDLLVKALAEHRLVGGPGPQLLGVLELRLTHNPGVAFSLGATLPAWIIVAVTGLITAALGVYAWRAGSGIAGVGRIGLAGMLGVRWPTSSTAACPGRGHPHRRRRLRTVGPPPAPRHPYPGDRAEPAS